MEFGPLNLRASCGVRAGKDTFVAFDESSKVNAADLACWGLLCFRGIHSSAFSSRLLAMSSKIFSILAITSVLAGRRVDAIANQERSSIILQDALLIERRNKGKSFGVSIQNSGQVPLSSGQVYSTTRRTLRIGTAHGS